MSFIIFVLSFHHIYFLLKKIKFIEKNFNLQILYYLQRKFHLNQY